MKIITKKDHINGVYSRWSNQYAGWSGDKAEIAIKLRSAKTKLEIDSIIGNDSWTKLRCSYCESDVDAVAKLIDDCECYFAICLSCAGMIVKSIKGADK